MNYFSYRIKLFKLTREIERIQKSYSKNLEVSKQQRDREEMQSLLSALHHEQSKPEEKIKLLKTQGLVTILKQ